MTEWQNSILKNLVMSLYEDLLEADECHTSYYVEKYARQITDAGIDIHYCGMEQLFDAIKLDDQLAEQYKDSNPRQAAQYRQEAETRRLLARTLGWNVVERGGSYEV